MFKHVRQLAGVAALTLAAQAAYADDDTIKVGVLHSLSGTMAISETTLKDTVLMMVEEQNKKGGLLGKKLEAVVVDPASDWPLFAEKARELIEIELSKRVEKGFGEILGKESGRSSQSSKSVASSVFSGA